MIDLSQPVKTPVAIVHRGKFVRVEFEDRTPRKAKKGKAKDMAPKINRGAA